MPYAGQRGPPYLDPSRAQQAQFSGMQYFPGHSPMQAMPRQQGFPLQNQVPFVDPYAYGMNPMDPRFAAQPPFAVPRPMPTDMGKYTFAQPCGIDITNTRTAQLGPRGSDRSPIPTFPRGPPRKPKQSGHALWVGNLPPAASVTDLKDHFSRDATSDIESVFLIAKSNCAFVNYRSEAACMAAMNRFHDSRFHGVRLVCRLRRGTSSSSSAAVPDEPAEPEPSPILIDGVSEDSPTIARSQSGQSGTSVETPAATDETDAKVREKYFIVKSLTAQDLEASVRNGIWATQSHNEEVLNRAFTQAENVYLIFSANKSGEYFGYARMASQISGEPVNLSAIPVAEETATDPAVSPQSIPTPATATAPRGRIIDDSARGTIFWEAELSDTDEGSPDKESVGTASSGQNWGRQFRIEWLSTNRLPFYRTRGLRNPWNANREVKIARDGTELEPSVGRRLVSMFFRPSPGPNNAGGGAAAGMPLR